MKKSGIVLCVFSLLLIISGIVLCFIAKGKGDVFDNTVITDGDYTKRTPITSDLNYIKIDYTAVDVNIHGGASEDYIETVNIEDDQINTSKSAGITVADKSDYLSMAYDTVMKFSGLRNIIFPGKSNSGKKTVDIYLSGKYRITQLDIETENGDVTISDLDSNTDYKVAIAVRGNITLENVRTRSAMNLSTTEGNVSLNDIEYVKLDGHIITGNLYTHENAPGGHRYDLSCENGMIYLLDESQGSHYQVDGGDPALNFSVTYGNISLNNSKKSE